MSSSCVYILSLIAWECDLDLYHFNIEHAFVQSDFEENIILRLPKGCGNLLGKVVRLNNRFLQIEASLAYVACLSDDVS